MNFKIGSSGSTQRPAGLSFGVKTQPKAKTSVKPSSASGLFQESLDHDEKMGHEFSKAKLPDLMKVHTKLVQRQADKLIKEDPTVFQYDEVYEEECSQPLSQVARTEALEQKKRVGLVVRSAPGRAESRYLTKIIAATDNRKVEQSIIEDKLIKKKREEEGNLFGDKEEFMTGAYKEELRKRKEFEDDLRNKDIIDAKNDAMRKQQGTGFADFNRNLLNSGLARAGARRDIAEKQLESNFAAPGGYKIREDAEKCWIHRDPRRSVELKMGDGVEEVKTEETMAVKMEVKEEPDATADEGDGGVAQPSSNIKKEEEVKDKEEEVKEVKKEVDIKMKEEPAESEMEAEEKKGPTGPTAADILAAAGRRYADEYEVGSGRSQAHFLRKQVEKKVQDEEFERQKKKLKVTQTQGQVEKPEAGPIERPLSAEEVQQVRENKSQSAKERFLARKKAAAQAS